MGKGDLKRTVSSQPSSHKQGGDQGSERVPSRGADTSGGKKGKIVTFQESEIVADNNRQPMGDSPGPSSKDTKKKKGKIDIGELDRGMEKLNQKAQEKDASSSADNVRQYAEQPWELEPADLKVGKLLGHGAYGRVYKGTYKDKKVAIKMLEWGDAEIDPDREISLQYNFFQEVQMMYKLAEHPHICKLLGATMGSNELHVPSPLGRHQVQVSKAMCCIVMEYMSGGTLREFWINHRRSGKRRMPFKSMVQFAIDIADGIAYLHSKMIFHRDLKPDNILMTKDCVVKIADFGIARPWPEPHDHLSLHRGTPCYSAPEVLDGRDYDHKCDVYSYGICLWEIYTCDVPYPEMHGMVKDRTTIGIIKGDLRPKIPCCCPPELKYIMMRCWQQNPKDRPEMAEVLKWLRKINTDKVRWITNDVMVEQCTCLVDATCGYRG